jgi:hypothetical protein
VCVCVRRPPSWRYNDELAPSKGRVQYLLFCSVARAPKFHFSFQLYVSVRNLQLSGVASQGINFVLKRPSRI